MNKENDVKILMLICGVLIGLGIYFVYDYYSVDSIDVDCLVDDFESFNLSMQQELIGMDFFNEQTTFEYFTEFYWRKHPKSRFLMEQALTYELKKCEK